MLLNLDLIIKKSPHIKVLDLIPCESIDPAVPITQNGGSQRPAVM